LKPIAKRRGFLEFEPARGVVHQLLDPREQGTVASIEKGAELADAAAIFAARAGADARADAGTEFEAQALRRSFERKQFRLIGERHRHGVRTIAKLEPVVEPPDCIFGSVEGRERTITGGFFAGRRFRDESKRRWRPANAQVVMSRVTGQPDHIETRPQPLDQFELSKKRSELVAGLFPDQRAGVLDDFAGFRIAAVLAEVTEEPGAKVLGFSDVDEAAVGIEHAVDAGQARGMIADAAQEPRDFTGANAAADDGFFFRSKKTRAKTGKFRCREKTWLRRPIHGCPLHAGAPS